MEIHGFYLVPKTLEIHGFWPKALKIHCFFRDTRFLTKSLEDARFLVFIIPSFYVLDSSLVKGFTSCMLTFFRLVIFYCFYIAKGFKICSFLCASKHCSQILIADSLMQHCLSL